MQEITLAAIKEQQEITASMIASFEAQTSVQSVFPVEVPAPKLLEPGELFVSTIILDAGKTRYHLYLPPGDHAGAPWDTQMALAKEKGLDLPNRFEQALLHKTMRDQFKDAAYWSNEKHASDSDCAWCQNFSAGNQHNWYTDHKLRARFVRRAYF